MEYLIYLAPITLGITQVAKYAAPKTRIAPIVAILVGVALSFLFHGGYSTGALVDGLVAALTAAGFYSGVKKVVNG